MDRHIHRRIDNQKKRQTNGRKDRQNGRFIYNTIHVSSLSRKLNQLDLLFQSSLAIGSDLNKTASEVLLFRLCRDIQSDNEKRLEVGLLALRRWKDRHGQPPPLNGNVFDHLLCDNGPDLHAVLGLLWVCALAVFIDLIPTRTLSKARPAKMASIEKLLTAVAENWIDPLVSFHVLIEVCLCSL